MAASKWSLLCGMALAGGLAGCTADVVPSSSIASCTDLAATCGPKKDEICCANSLVTGGEYERLELDQNKSYRATVSDFRLDRFEVTVGRFRRFLSEYPGNMPVAGDGAHPNIENSGWYDSWPLPQDQAELHASVECNPDYQTWTDEPGDGEHKPINCVNWYVAFAFCAWDGGRLPTEAEWTYAAARGSEETNYPWGSAALDQDHAVYCPNYSEVDQGCPTATRADIADVGSRSPAGDGKWGQTDLAGNVREWTLDFHDVYPDDCVDCANLTNVIGGREARGGDWNNDAASLSSYQRIGYDPTAKMSWVGFRCARRPR
ncbi:formylglycine-generating enzyme family protein [Polyangium sp. 6x1]|uniref:formylglycine-generating enzyme family protein n=1 Tax=Polyangium sp. 6x1 TaxID=3042689 RepID=UPI002482B715|nr:formylglycine-generating enzyme family protein [Polyangium sp. 6x1]MDI1445985.1 formylglycine-generating enzyme family protein [Polyangium sp. 6x1]